MSPRARSRRLRPNSLPPLALQIVAPLALQMVAMLYCWTQQSNQYFKAKRLKV
jgi:hypothetical protein